MSAEKNINIIEQAFITFSLIGQNLGFHNSLSFLLAIAGLVFIFAFLVTGSIFLYKKNKERKQQLETIVKEIQKEYGLDTKEEIIVKTLEKPPLIDTKDYLSAALEKTKQNFMNKLVKVFSKTQALDYACIEEFENILFTADIGVKTANFLLDLVKKESLKKSMTGFELRDFLKQEMKNILLKPQIAKSISQESPLVIMFIGVNGAGKTTSIGKMGKKYIEQGKSVVFAAGDTFRAAAVEQLSVWAERINAQIIKEKEGYDSAAVLFKAINYAKEQNIDVVLCDTAGRLHTKVGLMDELKKVTKVVNKAMSSAPHEVYLVIDSTMGQNAIIQAKEFSSCAPITGVVLSKLDGSAKGGVALGISHELNIPIQFIGVGERIEDLKEFDADKFVDELFA